MIQPGAFAFDGSTYEANKDFKRLSGQLRRVFNVMKDGQWRSLENIALVTGCTTQSVSARLRDFRKDKFGGHQLERERYEGGLHLYRLVVRVPEALENAEG